MSRIDITTAAQLDAALAAVRDAQDRRDRDQERRAQEQLRGVVQRIKGAA